MWIAPLLAGLLMLVPWELLLSSVAHGVQAAGEAAMRWVVVPVVDGLGAAVKAVVAAFVSVLTVNRTASMFVGLTGLLLGLCSISKEARPVSPVRSAAIFAATLGCMCVLGGMVLEGSGRKYNRAEGFAAGGETSTLSEPLRRVEALTDEETQALVENLRAQEKKREAQQAPLYTETEKNQAARASIAVLGSSRAVWSPNDRQEAAGIVWRLAIGEQSLFAYPNCSRLLKHYHASPEALKKRYALTLNGKPTQAGINACNRWSLNDVVLRLANESWHLPPLYEPPYQTRR